MLRAGPLRSRLDEIRSRFVDGVPSHSLEVATDRLLEAVDRHFADHAASALTADRLVSALDVIPQGIVLADGTGEIVFRNPAVSGFFAARHGEALVGSAITELISAAVAGKAETRTVEIFGPPRRALQLRAVPLDAGPGRSGEDPEADARGAGGAFLIVEDVSERQRLEAVRRDFVSNISHELKTPVGALGVLAETLADEEDPVVAHRLAERMQREAFRVARTIDDLLELSQIEASELSSPEPVSVQRVLAEAIDRTQSVAELRSIRYLVHDPAPRLVVMGDRRQLVSAVANLCENAIKYSDEGATVELSIRSDEQSVEIDVADHGLGIPARDLERVFERFYRVDRARSRDTGGTGLGLAIVRHVVQNHGGEVTVQSREGEGSVFTLRLPAGPGRAASDPTIPSSSQASA